MNAEESPSTIRNKSVRHWIGVKEVKKRQPKKKIAKPNKYLEIVQGYGFDMFYWDDKDHNSIEWQLVNIVPFEQE